MCTDIRGLSTSLIHVALHTSAITPSQRNPWPRQFGIRETGLFSPASLPRINEGDELELLDKTFGLSEMLTMPECLGAGSSEDCFFQVGVPRACTMPLLRCKCDGGTFISDGHVDLRRGRGCKSHFAPPIGGRSREKGQRQTGDLLREVYGERRKGGAAGLCEVTNSTFAAVSFASHTMVCLPCS